MMLWLILTSMCLVTDNGTTIRGIVYQHRIEQPSGYSYHAGYRVRVPTDKGVLTYTLIFPKGTLLKYKELLKNTREGKPGEIKGRLGTDGNNRCIFVSSVTLFGKALPKKRIKATPVEGTK